MKMKTSYKIGLSILFIIALLSSVYATEMFLANNINGKGIRYIKNITWFNATQDFCIIGGNCLTNVTSGINGSGTVTSVSGDGTYVTGTITASGTFGFNETNLNTTITAVAGAGSGSVTNVSAGDGMNFSDINTSGAVTMGTPTTLTGSTGNAVTATSHAHTVTTDQTGECTGGSICGAGHTHTWTSLLSRLFTTIDNVTLNISNNILGVNTTNIQNRVDGTCAAGQAMSVINENGTVTCVSTTGNVTGFNSTDKTLNSSGLIVGLNTTYTNTLYVSRSDWTTIDSYPASCAADTYVQAVGDTLTCVNVVNDTDTTYTGSVSVPLTGTTFSLNNTYTTARYVNRSVWTSIDNYPSGCAANNYVQSIGDTLTCVNVVNDTDTTYSAGNGISLGGTTFTVAGNTALTQDADGLSVTADGVGDTQLTYNTGQHLNTTSAVTFLTVDTGQGANELYDMNQNVNTTDAVTFATIDTGQGANELYNMDQNVSTISEVTFADINITTNTLEGTANGCIWFNATGVVIEGTCTN